MPRFSANLSFLFPDVPFLDRFAEAADAGFRAVEFAFPYEFPTADLVERVRARNLEVVLINAPPGDLRQGDRGTASLAGREHEFAADFEKALRYARALRCPRVHVMAGVVTADADPAVMAARRADQRARFVRNMREACREAATQGVTLLIEALNPRDVPDYLFSTQAEAHALRQEIDAPNAKVQMDLYHAQMVEGGLADKLRRYLPNVGHLQIAGVPGRHEPDVGEINYAYLFKLIDDLGYAGWIGCEYRPLGSTAAGLGWLYRLLDRRPATTA